MKAFFRAHAAHSGGLDAHRRPVRVNTCDMPWATRTALSALKARYDSGHQIPHKTGLGETEFNIFLSPRAFKTSPIESNDCRRRLNAKKHDLPTCAHTLRLYASIDSASQLRALRCASLDDVPAAAQCRCAADTPAAGFHRHRALQRGNRRTHAPRAPSPAARETPRKAEASAASSPA